MKCQNCGKEEATVKYSENINGEKSEIMLCNTCAKSLNLMDFPNMMSYFFSSYPKELFADEYEKEVCDKCSYTFDDYLKNGLFGCPNCYNAFTDRIDSLLTKIHGKNRHLITNSVTKASSINKTSSINKIKTITKDEKQHKKISNISDIKELKNLLDLSIKDERYEDAAKIRDRIRELEK